MKNKNIVPAILQSEKIAEQQIKILKADPEFKRLKKLVPAKLKNKDSGKDYEVVTTNENYSGNREKVIILSKAEWIQYEKLQVDCDKLAGKYNLRHWVVFNLAVGVKTLPIPEKQIRCNLRPHVFLPKNFDSKKHYTHDLQLAPLLQASEIMNRLPDNISKETYDEIWAYLEEMMRKIPECQIMELKEAPANTFGSNGIPEINVDISIPPGFSAREVSRIYGQLDNRRRLLMSTLGVQVPKRRRVSRILENTESLELFKNGSNSYNIIDKIYGENFFMENDQDLRKSVNSKRFQGRKILRRRGILPRESRVGNTPTSTSKTRTASGARLRRRGIKPRL